MAAFEKGIGAGAAGVELDIWRCGSGELVVVHDESVPGLGSISHLSLESIRRFNGQIPTLKEVLVGLPSSVINIEIKSSKRDSRLSNGHPVLDSLVALLGETSNCPHREAQPGLFNRLQRSLTDLVFRQMKCPDPICYCEIYCAFGIRSNTSEQGGRSKSGKSR